MSFRIRRKFSDVLNMGDFDNTYRITSTTTRYMDTEGLMRYRMNYCVSLQSSLDTFVAQTSLHDQNLANGARPLRPGKVQNLIRDLERLTIAKGTPAADPAAVWPPDFQNDYFFQGHYFDDLSWKVDGVVYPSAAAIVTPAPVIDLNTNVAAAASSKAMEETAVPGPATAVTNAHAPANATENNTTVLQPTEAAWNNSYDAATNGHPPQSTMPTPPSSAEAPQASNQPAPIANPFHNRPHASDPRIHEWQRQAQEDLYRRMAWHAFNTGNETEIAVRIRAMQAQQAQRDAQHAEYQRLNAEWSRWSQASSERERQIFDELHVSLRALETGRLRWQREVSDGLWPDLNAKNELARQFQERKERLQQDAFARGRAERQWRKQTEWWYLQRMWPQGIPPVILEHYHSS